ncbi:hypothetical protein BU23DRAFT_572144 [Bimuria novae-zelandiae CBS 107.79]|uniref:Uncharacterized protein n=1 Tax=Bimuria novae-zelandiae CBS 107.79 TaxID=1447943 RepID=A0A6A5UVL5_9PLEO|nr:hypothetical protein BU23DRAFT_572144 [Bimuria novae-zelandiae CBS 107.79]
MAGRIGSGATGQLPLKLEAIATTKKVRNRHPRSQRTLIGITALLNVLLFSSLLCIFNQIYQIVDDAGDKSSIAAEVLTLTSRIWRHQGRHPSGDKKTSYIAVRFAVTPCILWLLTGGWNMIIVTRRPTCLELLTIN